MTGEQQAIIALAEFTKAANAVMQLHKSEIEALKAGQDRLQQHVEGLMARIAVLDKRRRK